MNGSPSSRSSRSRSSMLVDRVGLANWKRLLFIHRWTSRFATIVTRDRNSRLKEKKGSGREEQSQLK